MSLAITTPMMSAETRQIVSPARTATMSSAVALIATMPAMGTRASAKRMARPPFIP